MNDRALTAHAPATDPATDASEVATATWEFRIAEGAEPPGDLLDALAAMLIDSKERKRTDANSK